jgi:hypothetical protein
LEIEPRRSFHLCGVLPRYQSDPGCKLASGLERDHVHMFLDLRCRCHKSLLPCDLPTTHSQTKGSSIKDGHRLVDPSGLNFKDDDDALVKAEVIAIGISLDKPAVDPERHIAVR